VLLMVVGAILAFAVEDNVPAIRLPIVGVILMIAGAAIIAYARHGEERERRVRRVEETADPDTPVHITEEIIREHDRH
jgi:uncharacterized membrane protein